MNSKDKNTKEKILIAAKKLFSKYNFDYVGTRMIANEAGVGQSAIFFHYGTKENLCAAVIEDILFYHRQYFVPICERMYLAINQNKMTPDIAYDFLMEFIDAQLNLVSNPKNRIAFSFSINSRTLPQKLYQPLYNSVADSVEMPMAELIGIYKHSSDMSLCYILSHAITTCIVAFTFNGDPKKIYEIETGHRKNYVKDNLRTFIINLIKNAIV